MKEIIKLVMGPFMTNTYIIKENNHCLIIDPAANPNRILENVGECFVDAICLTHGHFDHIQAVDKLQKKCQCNVYVSLEDEEMLRDPMKNSSYMVEEFVIKTKVKYYQPETQINQFKLKVIDTPGHTKGSVLIIIDDYMFSGDTLFKEGIGRCDLYGGSFSQMKSSIQKIKNFEQDFKVYPGHGEESTLYHELSYNPYF